MEFDETSKWLNIVTLVDKDLIDGQDQVEGVKTASAVDDDPDERSVFVKNVDFSADEAQLTEHF